MSRAAHDGALGSGYHKSPPARIRAKPRAKAQGSKHVHRHETAVLTILWTEPKERTPPISSERYG